MPEIIASITSVINIAKKLKDASDKVKDADFRILIANLNVQLAEVKMQLADVLHDNATLRAKLRELEAADSDPCPRCRKRSFELEKSEPDPMMGDMGVLKRTYKCSLCGFTESKVVVPN